MTITEIQERWQSIPQPDTSAYRSLRINSVCIPDLYIALDNMGKRHLILQIPPEAKVECKAIRLENLSLEWHKETRYIMIGLQNNRFTDLFNELVISFYNHVKAIHHPQTYANKFIDSFYKWSEFFEFGSRNALSEEELKGLFGELVTLKWLLENYEGLHIDEIINAWQGPYNKPQDFILPAYTLEIKTKNENEVNVQISSEFQLDCSLGRKLHLGIVDVISADDGINIQELVNDIKFFILSQGGEVLLFLKGILRFGLVGNNAQHYNHYRWKAVKISLFECTGENFPKLIPSHLPAGISTVKYNLNTSFLQEFTIQSIKL